MKSYRNSEINKIFKPNLIRLFNLTGKPVIIFAHSLGNLNIQYQLSKLPVDFKKKYIKLWMAVAPPFLGAMQSTKSMIGGDDEYFFLGEIGFHFKASATSLGSMGSMYEIMLRNMYSMYQNEPWFEWVQKRLDYEQGKRSKEDSGMLFWPSIEEHCTSKSFTNRDSKCFSGLDDMRTRPSVVVDNKNYFLDDNRSLISDWPLNEFSLKYYDVHQDKEYEKMTNPEVPVVLIFSKAGRTIKQTLYEGKISDYTSKNQYPKAKDVMGYGDGTVQTNSALIPAIKWAYEFQNKETYGNKGLNYKVSKIMIILYELLIKYVLPKLIMISVISRDVVKFKFLIFKN